MVYYSEKMIEHFRNPQNMGEIKNPDAVGRAGNPICGDLMEIFLRIGPGERIEDIKFKTFGCAAAIATSSMMTVLAKGKTIEEALKISKQEIADELEGLPPIKMHCSVLATEALEEAIKNYKAKHQVNN